MKDGQFPLAKESEQFCSRKFLARILPSSQAYRAQPGGRNTMKSLLWVTGICAGVILGAFAANEQDLKPDRQDIRQDGKDVREDTQDIRQDRRDIRRDTRDLRQDRKDVREDTREIRQDRRDIIKDRQKLRDAYKSGDPAAIKAAREQLEKDRRERSEEHTSELQSRPHLVCRLLLEKKKKNET